MTVMRTPDPVTRWLFAYGSLQPGAWNYEAVFGEKMTLAVPATARGQVFLASPRMDTYPVARFDIEGTIHGHVIQVDILSREWQSICWMELQSGYDLVEVETRPAVPLDSYEEYGTHVSALAFQYDALPIASLRIPTGDWLEFHLSPERWTAAI